MSDELAIYTVYDHPSDFPDEFVIRRHTIGKRGEALYDKELFFRSEKLQDCRDRMEDMLLYNLGRYCDDDPVIIESYI